MTFLFATWYWAERRWSASTAAVRRAAILLPLNGQSVTTAVTSVTLSPSSLLLTDVHEDSLYQGMSAITSPVSGTSHVWSSSNENVARVISWGDSATVEGYSTGTALILVLVDGAVTDTATVTVQCGTKQNPSCIQYGPDPM